MSMTSRATVELRRAGSFGVVSPWVASWLRALAMNLDRRAAIRELQESDDRELWDIGITRSQIEDAVKGEFRRRGG